METTVNIGVQGLGITLSNETDKYLYPEKAKSSSFGDILVSAEC